MYRSFVKSVSYYFSPIGNIVVDDSINHQIKIKYHLSEEDISKLDILAKESGIKNYMYYEYINDTFVLHLKKPEGGGNSDLIETLKTFKIPESVKEEAKLGLILHDVGYNGGTDTGYNRAIQLQKDYIDIDTLRVIRNWFARHFYVSRSGYLKWIQDGKPTNYIAGRKNFYRGAIAWLIWGGDAAYNWIKSTEIQDALNKNYSNKDNNLPIIN